MNYYEKLKDPRWQKLRLEVMEANEFHCEMCGDGEETLHVHHKEYFKGYEPWDYHKDQLAVICKTCHELFHSKPDILKMVCSYIRLEGPVNREEIAFLIAGYMANVEYGAINIEYNRLIEVCGIEDQPDSPNKAHYDAGVQAACIESRLTKEYSRKRLKKHAN